MSEMIRRTHMCGNFTAGDIGESIGINGWVAKRRNLGGLIFCDIRDRTGIVQVVFDDTVSKDLFNLADSLRSEYVVGIEGKVRERKAINKDLPTGDVEIVGSKLIVYSTSETPPIYIKDDDKVDDNLRLKYRYLDLRKNQMQENLKFRHRLTKICRDYFDSMDFIEVETPMLIKPTPEGARDYIVPSRVHNGMFYALPQSPQMFKQLLMVAGVDRYMQIVKCFRDEDLRADRQPEFTQIDLEMSFVDEEDIYQVQEGFLKKVMKELMGIDIATPFDRISYGEAMERFGCDKPDRRFGMELSKLNDLFEGCEFKVFTDCLSSGGDIRCICVKGGSGFYTRKKIDKLTEGVKDYGAKGLVWMKKSNGEISSSINKFFTAEALEKIFQTAGGADGDLILILSGEPKVTYDGLGFLRSRVADEMGLIPEGMYNFLWVTDFPLYEYDEKRSGYVAKHHPFTSPSEEDLDILESNPELVRARAYDIVLNGVEIGGGSIRIHDRNLQERMFKNLGLSEEEIDEKFGFLVDAFKYGAPPHGGIAYGLDRLAMILAGKDSIRDVIAFPKNQAAQCMVSGAPSVAEEEQLAELGISEV